MGRHPALLYAPLFRFLERLGLHVTPNHFHFPIPDTSRLPESVWTQRSSLVGLALQPERQEALLVELVKAYGNEMRELPRTRGGNESGFFLENGHFETVDAEIYYGLIRSRAPRRILEIGAGFSTRLAQIALGRNRAEGREGSLVLCDPSPPAWVGEESELVRRVVARPVQELPLEEFTSLESGDILFIDSSHVVAVGSDVRFLLLEALPRLTPGVLVHLHDIFLPAEYPRYWVRDRLRFWNEQYLLQAFLAFNGAFRIVWASHYMALTRRETLAGALPSFGDKSAPGSFWIERVGDEESAAAEPIPPGTA